MTSEQDSSNKLIIESEELRLENLYDKLKAKSQENLEDSKETLKNNRDKGVQKREDVLFEKLHKAIDDSKTEGASKNDKESKIIPNLKLLRNGR